MTDHIVAYAKELFDITITPQQLEMLTTLQAELLTWNEQLNLTAITDPEAIQIRHFLDSLSLATVVDFAAGAKMIDVGTGAGFPGLVIAIMYPETHVTLLDSTGKKLKFIDHVIAQLGLKNARTLHGRAEDIGQISAEREKYDVVVARAVARLPALLEYCLPLVRVGGVFVAMKGTTAYEEVDATSEALRVLGGRIDDVVAVQLPTMTYSHYLIVTNKIKPTPRAYPRKPGVPTREPLED
jgi:16S rRNA (guanine527-N7)-methyltransferase